MANRREFMASFLLAASGVDLRQMAAPEPDPAFSPPPSGITFFGFINDSVSEYADVHAYGKVIARVMPGGWSHFTITGPVEVVYRDGRKIQPKLTKKTEIIDGCIWLDPKANVSLDLRSGIKVMSRDS